MKIMEINADERPRERLISAGARALSNTELLAILLRNGSGGINVLDLARELMTRAGSLTRLAAMSGEVLMETKGIGKDKSATIMAAFELGRRFSAEEPTLTRTSITGPAQIYAMMHPLLKGLDHEECWILYLNRSNYVIAKEKLSTGGLSSTTFDTNMVVRKALEKKADGLIVVHNHPSGNPYPGSADLKQTAALKKAAGTFEISLMDHIVIADSCFYSFSEERIVHQNEVSTEKLAPV